MFLEKKEKAVKKEIERPDFPEKDFRDGARESSPGLK